MPARDRIRDIIYPLISYPLTGWLALAGRTMGLGLERPLVKALGQGRNSIAATVVYFGLGELMLLPFVVWHALADPQYLAGIEGWIWQAAVTSVIYAVSFHAYIRAMSTGEISFLSPLFGISFIWLYVLDLIFGSAGFTVAATLGILAVTAGVVFLNITPGLRLSQVLNPLSVIRRPGAPAMILYAFGLATGRMIDSSVADTAPPMAYALVNSSLTVIAGLAVLGAGGRTSAVVNLLRERTTIAVSGAAVGMFSYVMLLVALDYFNPSVVEPVSQVSMLLAIWFGALFFKERIGLRWAAAVLVIAGAALLVSS